MKVTEKILQRILVILAIIIIVTIIGFLVLAICFIWVEDDVLIHKWLITNTIVSVFTIISWLAIHSLLNDY